jgi:methyltransferase-like protein/tRNA1(Val) A37 N6-methylase TrmN6
MTQITTNNTYDEIPYQSYPYAQSSPEHLRTFGVLFGMNPPPIETARVLELGCAEGGNIIPHAAFYPKAQFVGVDLSKVQIDAGIANIKALGLKNIELKHCSINDIDEKFGKFDYIICHGVISWVPDFVRDKIFEISSKNLTPNGVAYISYNTLPGWNMIRTIRDMMLYHSQNFVSAQDKVSQSRLLIDFVKDSLQGQDTPYANVLRNEAELLSGQSDHYLRHDHLEEENKQFYFNEFIKEAAKNNMQYLSDCSLATMYIGNMPQNVIDTLQGLNDIVRTEQYMDFIRNRRFRSTLLCHANVPLHRNLSNETAKKFTMSCHVTPSKPLGDVDLYNATENLQFYYNGNQDNVVSTTSAGLKAVLYVFAENINNPLSFDQIVAKACLLLKNKDKSVVELDLLGNAMNLIVKGYINIALTSGNKDKINLDKPKVSLLNIHQVTTTANKWVTNVRHSAIAISDFDKFAIKYMDGSNTHNQIVEKLVQDVKNGQINVMQDNKKIEDEEEIKSKIDELLKNSIARLSTQAIFI